MVLCTLKLINYLQLSKLRIKVWALLQFYRHSSNFSGIALMLPVFFNLAVLLEFSGIDQILATFFRFYNVIAKLVIQM